MKKRKTRKNEEDRAASINVNDPDSFSWLNMFISFALLKNLAKDKIPRNCKISDYLIFFSNE